MLLIRLGENLRAFKMSHGLSITANSLPTIVMIPASFTPASFYKRTLNKLRDIGFEAVVHALPSASRLPPQNAATLADDVAFFYGVVKGLIGQGKDVVLVAHSYGGIVASELTRGLTKLERMKFGEKNGLVRLVFIAAVVPTVGESLNDVLGSPANLAYQVRNLALVLLREKPSVNPDKGRIHEK